MAWSAPRTWVTGETLTSTLLNTHVRDQFLAVGGPLGTAYVPATATSDLAAPTAWAHYLTPTASGNAIRSIAAPANAGQRLVLRNNTAFTVSLLHLTAGGSGAQIYLRSQATVTLAQGEVIELYYDGTQWAEIDRNQAGGGLVSIFDVVVGRGQAGDPTSPAPFIDTNTILGGNIPQTFNHLKLVIQGRMNDATTFDNLLLTLNNDTGANYDVEWMYAQGAAVGSTENIANAFGFLGYIASANAAAGSAGNYEVVFPNYARTDFHKQYVGTFGTTAQATTNLLTGTVTGKLRSTLALTRIKILGSTGSFVTGTRATLYGML